MTFGRRYVFLQKELRDELCRRLVKMEATQHCPALAGQVKLGLTPEIRDWMDFELCEVSAGGLNLVADCVAELIRENYVLAMHERRLSNSEDYARRMTEKWGLDVTGVRDRLVGGDAKALEALETFLREKTALLEADPSLVPGLTPVPVGVYEFEWGEWEVEFPNDMSGYQRPDFGAVPTAEELQTPPVGWLQKLYCRDINEARKGMKAALEALPPGAAGQDSPWFWRFYVWRVSVDKLAWVPKQRDAVERVRAMAKVFLAHEAGTLPAAYHEPMRHMLRLGRTIGHAIARHIIENDGAVDAQMLEWFITYFSVKEFTQDSGPPGEIWPVDGASTVDAAGIMILAPARVVAWLKAQPWQRASRFLGGRTAGEAFQRYAAGGDSIPVLQRKYAAAAADIDAQWSELADWVEAQKTVAGQRVSAQP